MYERTFTCISILFCFYLPQKKVISLTVWTKKEHKLELTINRSFINISFPQCFESNAPKELDVKMLL